MERTIFEQIGGTYHKEGEHLLPDLTVTTFLDVGIWGERRRQYLREHQKAIYTGLLLSGKLNDHIADINQQAEAMFFQLVKQLAEQEGITEQFKAENQMEWVRKMNNIRNRAKEIVYNELIYVL